MLTNYFKVTFRNLKKNKIYSFINIIGLAIGIACTILLLQWVQDELSYDRFHENADNLYVATFSNGSTVTPTALCEFLKSEYPEIIHTSRLLGMGRNLFRYGEKETMESGGIMTDPDFLKMFSIPFIHGDPAVALNNPNSIVISENLAETYFEGEDAIGKTINIEGAVDLNVTGVIENYPHNSHIQFEYIMPLALSRKMWRNNLNTWEYNNIRTYVQLQKGTPAAVVDPKISDVVERHRLQDQRPLSLQSITRLHLYRFTGGGGLITYVYIFSALAMFILLIACINFMNLTTAKSAARAREVGMRKTVGASNADLIIQFFSESILMTVVSLLFGILFIALFLPVFNNLTGKQFTMAFLLRMSGITGIVGITLLSGLIAGSYPALFLSQFQPVKVIKGAIGSGRKSLTFRKILVVTQFSLSIFLILGTFFIHSQINFMKNRELGFNKDNVVYMSPGSRFIRNIDRIKEEMLRNPNILNLTLTNIAPYRWNTNAGIGDVHWEGKTNQEVKMVVTSVDYDYLDTFGLQIAQGRFFSKEYATDASDAYVVNEAAVRALEMDSPIGKELRIWEEKGKIIGVLKDYHFESLHNEIIPMAMRINPRFFAHVCIRINPDNVPAALSFIENKWNEIYPEYPFEYNFLDDTIKSQYRSEESVGRIFKSFTYLAIFISCLGLFGLSLFTTEQRTKEIGIRKVLGASAPKITLLLSTEFIKWVVLANAIAWPAAWYFMNKWLQGFAYRTNVGLWTFVLAGILTISVSLVTVSSQTIKAAVKNPADSLRYE